jgi:hypothetical protein
MLKAIAGLYQKTCRKSRQRRYFWFASKQITTYAYEKGYG